MVDLTPFGSLTYHDVSPLSAIRPAASLHIRDAMLHIESTTIPADIDASFIIVEVQSPTQTDKVQQNNYMALPLVINAPTGGAFLF